MKRAGVLALQGAVSEHMKALAAVGVAGVLVRKPADLDGLDGLILPGGESTVLSRLMRQTGLYDPLKTFAAERPVMGTCAGLILCASSVAEVSDNGETSAPHAVEPLGLMPICASRNGFGRQVDSFEATIAVEGIGENIPAIFIRAPYIASASPEVRILARVEDRAVMAQHGRILVMAFHPELADDPRIMEYFSRMS